MRRRISVLVIMLVVVMFGAVQAQYSGPLRVDLGSVNVNRGVVLRPNDDGDTIGKDMGGKDCRCNVDPATDTYLYFAVDDPYAYQGSRPNLYITIDYFDTGSGSLDLQYDSPGNDVTNNYKNGGTVALTGTNKWRQHTYHVTDAYFGNSQNAQSDFRVSKSGGGYFYFDTVYVWHEEPGAAGKADNNEPVHRALGVRRNLDLSWMPGRYALWHNLYFGAALPGEFRGSFGNALFDPGTLDANTTYYWRVDEVNEHGATKGEVWSFMTGVHLEKVGKLWEPVEWTYSNPSYSGNPYDLVATATFTHTRSGERIRTELFHDGGITWKLRFTGTMTGEWTFMTESADWDLHGLTGNVYVEANPGVAGFMTNFGNKWGRLGVDEAFVPQYVMFYDPAQICDDPGIVDKSIRTFFGEHGFNGFHTAVLCRWFDLYESRYDGLSDDPSPHRRTFEALEFLITKTHAAGGVVHIWQWGDEQRHMTPIRWGINGAVDRRIQRYICARLGPLPGWSMGYGFDLQEWAGERNLREWHEYMHDHLGWFHFLGGRSPEMTQIYNGLDYSSYQQHRPSYSTYVEGIEQLHSGKPSFFEDRFRIRDNGYPKKDYDLKMMRRGLWDSTMAGGAANIWGYLLNSPSPGVSGSFPNRDRILTYSRFWKSRLKKEMVRDNGLTDGLCLKVPGTYYVFYKQDTDSIQMDLSGMDGPRHAVAVDARQSYHEINLGALKPGPHVFNAPLTSDWAVVVGDPIPTVKMKGTLIRTRK